MIGGAFAYAEGDMRMPFVDGNYLLLTNARSAFYALHELLQPSITWLPSYTCRSLVNKQYNIKFYDAGRVTLDEAGKDDIVLVVNYFGWPHDMESDAVIVEDAAQAFFTPKKADYVIYSPSKCLGSPDGGILWSKHDLDGIELKDPPDEWVLSAREGRRRERSDWFMMTQEAKKLSPTGLYRMVYEQCLTFESNWAGKYVSNYSYLQSKLSKISLMGPLPPGVTPSGFPIVVDDREGLRKWLFANCIYPPVHWDIDGIVPNEFVNSHMLSKTIMTLPCDYRYGLDDMERMIACVTNYLEGANANTDDL